MKPTPPWYTTGAMTRFDRSHDPDRPGELLLHEGQAVAMVLWAHDHAERERTGWFLVTLDGDGEPDGEPPRRLAVSADVDALVGDARLPRREWLAQAETVELVTAGAALGAAERALARLLGEHP
jgi:hypothetical protein